MDTRLFQSTTSHDIANEELGRDGHYTIDFSALSSDVKDHIAGVSIEAVSFVNVLPNIRRGRNVLTWTVNGVGPTYSLVVPEDFYSLQRLTSYLNSSPLGSLAVFTVLANYGNDGGDRLQVEYTAGVSPGFLKFSNTDVFGEGCIEYCLGWGRTTLLFTSAPEIYQTRLSGPLAVSISSRALCASRTSVIANGRKANALVTIPITVPYGAIQTYYFDGTTRPTVLYGRSGNPLTNIDVDLHYYDTGEHVDLKGNEVAVSFRAYMSNR